VGTLSAALASMLNVKPIAVLKDGVLNMVEKVRTRKVSLDRIMEMGETASGDPQSAASLMEDAKNRFNVRDAVQSDLSISLAIN